MRVSELPDDLMSLIFDIAESQGVIEIPPRLDLKTALVSDFPAVQIGTNPADNRDAQYVLAMVGRNLPPLLVVDGHLIDGRHRLAALRLAGVEQVDYLDLSGIITVPNTPYIGPMRKVPPLVAMTPDEADLAIADHQRRVDKALAMRKVMIDTIIEIGIRNMKTTMPGYAPVWQDAVLAPGEEAHKVVVTMMRKDSPLFKTPHVWETLIGRDRAELELFLEQAAQWRLHYDTYYNMTGIYTYETKWSTVKGKKEKKD